MDHLFIWHPSLHPSLLLAYLYCRYHGRHWAAVSWWCGQSSSQSGPAWPEPSQTDVSAWTATQHWPYSLCLKPGHSHAHTPLHAAKRNCKDMTKCEVEAEVDGRGYRVNESRIIQRGGEDKTGRTTKQQPQTTGKRRSSADACETKHFSAAALTTAVVQDVLNAKQHICIHSSPIIKYI